MLIEVRLIGMGRTEKDTVVMLWQEHPGTRRCAMHFDVELTKWIRAALRKFSQDGMLIAHAALQDFMTRHLGTTVERVTIPELRGTTYRMVVHFRTPAGTITTDFLPSDAVAMLLYADCPLFVEESVLNTANAVAPTLEQLQGVAASNQQVENATELASTMPKDKLPQN